MSESPDSVTPDPLGGPISRPDGDGLPPGVGGERPRPGPGDAVDPGMAGEGDVGQDVGGGMAGEG